MSETITPAVNEQEQSPETARDYFLKFYAEHADIDRVWLINDDNPMTPDRVRFIDYPYEESDPKFMRYTMLFERAIGLEDGQITWVGADELHASNDVEDDKVVSTVNEKYDTVTRAQAEVDKTLGWLVGLEKAELFTPQNLNRAPKWWKFIDVPVA